MRKIVLAVALLIAMAMPGMAWGGNHYDDDDDEIVLDPSPDIAYTTSIVQANTQSIDASDFGADTAFVMNSASSVAFVETNDPAVTDAGDIDFIGAPFAAVSQTVNQRITAVTGNPASVSNVAEATALMQGQGYKEQDPTTEGNYFYEGGLISQSMNQLVNDVTAVDGDEGDGITVIKNDDRKIAVLAEDMEDLAYNVYAIINIGSTQDFNTDKDTTVTTSDP